MDGITVVTAPVAVSTRRMASLVGSVPGFASTVTTRPAGSDPVPPSMS